MFALDETGKAVSCVSLLERPYFFSYWSELLLLYCAVVHIMEHLLSTVASKITGYQLRILPTTKFQLLGTVRWPRCLKVCLIVSRGFFKLYQLTHSLWIAKVF